MNHLPAASHQVADHVKQLGDGFKIYDDTDGNYGHVGATIADTILQANRDYDKIVKPRIAMIIEKYGCYRTTSQLRSLLTTITVEKFLNYDSNQRRERFLAVLHLFEMEGIESCEDLQKWLQTSGSRGKLLNLHGIGPKTADYFGLLVGRPDTAIDRRLKGFLKEAGVDSGSYNEAKEIIKGAAVILKIDLGKFDHSIWQYMGGQGKGSSPARLCD